jgi:hypothetical protein
MDAVAAVAALVALVLQPRLALPVGLGFSRLSRVLLFITLVAVAVLTTVGFPRLEDLEEEELETAAMALQILVVAVVVVVLDLEATAAPALSS